MLENVFIPNYGLHREKSQEKHARARARARAHTHRTKMKSSKICRI